MKRGACSGSFRHRHAPLTLGAGHHHIQMLPAALLAHRPGAVNKGRLVTNVLAVASRLKLADAWKRAAGGCLLGSVGPTASAALRGAGLRVDIEPTHPKMGALVREGMVEAISRTRPPSSHEAP